MARLADIALSDPGGEPVRLGELIDRPTVLVVARYYGCLPCRDYLRRLADRYRELERAGAAAIGVSVGAPHQAKWLAETYGIPFPLLIDAERRVHESLALPRRWWVGLNPKGWLNYARAIVRGNRQGRMIEPNQTPGLAILDADADPVFIHRGSALGDYPPLDRVLARIGLRAT